MTSTNSSPPINSENIIFKCVQHSATISDKLQSFYEKNEFFDTVLIAGSNCVNIQGHRVVLCALSEYFLEIFRGGQTASKSNVVELKEIDASSLKLVINFMYAGWIELSLDTVEALLRTALFLKMKTLVDGCCGLIEKNINSSNSLKWFRLAKELNLPKLKVEALKCTYTHFEVLLKEKEILELSECELKDLLFNDNPFGDFEESVFLAMVAWISYDKLNRDHLAFQLLSKVRFQVLTPKFIVENRKLVCRTIESYELICSWLQWHLSPETCENDQQNCTLKSRKTEKLAVVLVCYEDKVYIETYDPIDNSFSTEIDIETEFSIKCRDLSIIGFDGKLIAVGELFIDSPTRVDCLDLETLKWTSLPEIKNLSRFIQLVDLKGYLCGLIERETDGRRSIEIFNFSKRKWHTLKSPVELSEYTQIAAHNGVLYVLDFCKGFLLSFTVSSKTWTSKVIERVNRENFYFAAIEGFFYVIGGIYKNNRTNAVKRYNLCDDSWCEMAPIPENNFYTKKTAVFKNKILIGDISRIQEYNYDTDTWKILNFSEPRRMYKYSNIFILKH